jgi:GT2 family glycosyltransferase
MTDRPGMAAGDPAMTLAVCICTRNRPEDLRAALASVERSSRPVEQVIVSDDSTDDASRRLVESEFPSVAWVQGPRIGLGANRNSALAHATATHVLFIDDDVQLGADFYATMRERWRGLPEADRPRAILGGAEENNGRLIMPSEQSFLGFQRRRYAPGEQQFTVVINACVFPRRLFDEIRFDPQLVYGYDEVDVTTQAVALGYRIVECFDVVNFHFPSPVNRDYYRPHTEASRLYVTAKRRGTTEGRPWAARAFLAVASVHVMLSAVRRDRLRGLASGARTLGLALGYLRRARGWDHGRNVRGSGRISG